MRADLYTAGVLNISRNKAAELIKEGKILFDGTVCTRVSKDVQEPEINLLDEIYVSRGALKLKSFLQDLGLNLNNKTALDIGSSTGGFVQVLLENGVKNVVALDVGSSQLHKSLRDDFRVKVFENTDIRQFQENTQFDIVTCDISFISMTFVLEYIIPFIKEFAILLFKPQFEVGKDVKRDKKGVVKDDKAISKTKAEFELKVASYGLVMQKCQECKVKGKEGNLEYFYLYKKVTP